MVPSSSRRSRPGISTSASPPDKMPIVVVTALFTGAIMVIQAAPIVKRYGAEGLLGWGAGFGTLREIAPLLTALMISGRVSFEIMQKALTARIPVIAAVSAPSSMAVQMALAADMTLIGFARNGGFNLYSGAQRVAPNVAELV